MEQNYALDVKDKRILLELEQDARISNQALAKRVGLHTDLVRYRIKRLQKEGVIGWFLTFVNFAKLGYTDYGVYLNVHRLSKQKEEEFLQFLQQHSRVTYLSRLGGKYDFFIGLLAQDILEFQQLLSEIMEKYGEYISNKDIAIRVQLSHFTKDYLYQGKKTSSRMPFFGGKVQIEKIDAIDTKILKQISATARMPIVELSQQLKIPASTIRERMKKLQTRGIIDGFFTFLRCQQYGYQSHIITISFKNISSQQENTFYTFCKHHPNIVYIIKTVGKWDYEISVETPHPEKFQEILAEIKDHFLENIQSLEFVTVFNDIKYTLFPFKD